MWQKQSNSGGNVTREPLKQCPGCKQWLTLHDLLYDPTISPQGIQIDPRDRSQCYFQFHHWKNGCLSTFLIHSTVLRNACELLQEGHSAADSVGCSGFCTEVHELAACTRPCTMRKYRQFLLSLWLSRSGPVAPSLTCDHQDLRQHHPEQTECIS
jgi:hypothetical protein